MYSKFIVIYVTSVIFYLIKNPADFVLGISVKQRRKMRVNNSDVPICLGLQFLLVFLVHFFLQ